MERNKIKIPNIDISVRDAAKAMKNTIDKLKWDETSKLIKERNKQVQLFTKNTILTNDPSMTAWGWAIMSYEGIVLKTGCIKTVTEGKKRRIRKSDETSQRISEINNVLLSLIRDNHVNYILTESPHGSQNASAAVMIGAVAAIVQTISDCLGIGVEFYSEQDSKKCLLNKKSATKQDTIDAIAKLYKVPWANVKYKDEAVADAIAIYHVASKQSSTLKLFKNGR
jgi:Holliday junction resolvasome RuvABC endonuclease subunit